MNKNNKYSIRKRRFRDDDFVKKDSKPNYNNDNENIIVDMNDIRNIMREFIIHKIDSDMEEVVKKYLSDKIISDDSNWK
jgi:Ribonuclease G/E